MKVDDSNRQLFAALGRVPSGLFIVTMRRAEKQTGMLASWVQQCSFQPPLVSVAVSGDRSIADWLKEEAEFTINILHESQTDMIAHFGKGFEPDEDAFADLEIQDSPRGAPVLPEIVGFIDCRVAARINPGDHMLVVAEVIDGRLLSDTAPMVHVRKSGAHY